MAKRHPPLILTESTRKPRIGIARVRATVKLLGAVCGAPLVAWVSCIALGVVDMGINSAAGIFGAPSILIFAFRPTISVAFDFLKNLLTIKQKVQCARDWGYQLGWVEAQKFRLCPSSGKNASSFAFWRDGSCGICKAAVDRDHGRVKDHLLPRIYVGVKEVDVDAHLIPHILKSN